MKVFYLAGSIIFTALILVLAFENIGASCSNMYFFFFPIDSNPTVVTLGITALGIITGLFYHAFIGKALSTSPEDEDADF